MPRRDSCASALAPRLSPKARGLSKTQAADIPDARGGRRRHPHMHEYVVACPPARFGALRRSASSHPASQLAANPSAGPGLLHEVKHDGFRIRVRKPDAVPHAAFGYAAVFAS
jgi:hypothetical protein